MVEVKEPEVWWPLQWGYLRRRTLIFVLLWHPSYDSTGADRSGRMQGVY